MGKPVNWNQVYYFSEVAASGSIKDASDRLGLSASTLSEHVAQLESDLNIQLFHRVHRKLVLTEEGTKLYRRAKEMFEVGERLLGDVSPVPLGNHPISVGLVPSPSLQVGYRLIGDFLKRYGPLDMKLFHARYGEIEVSVAKAEFDFGFSDRIPERKDIGYEKISTSPIKFFVSPSLGETSFAELLETLPLLICNAEPETRTLVEQALVSNGIRISRIVTADYPSVLTDLCTRGLGVGAFSEGLTTESLAEFKVLRAPRDAPKIIDNLYVYWPRGAEKREAIRNLFQLIKESKKEKET